MPEWPVVSVLEKTMREASHSYTCTNMAETEGSQSPRPGILALSLQIFVSSGMVILGVFLRHPKNAEKSGLELIGRQRY